MQQLMLIVIDEKNNKHSINNEPLRNHISLT